MSQGRESMETPYGKTLGPEEVPVGFVGMLGRYGDPTEPSFVRRLVLMRFPYPLLYLDAPVSHGTVHELVAPNLWAALSLLKERSLTEGFSKYAGCYCYRPKRGYGTRLSTHAFGAAIDGDAERFPLGSAERYPQEVVDCFLEYGFSYGGDFEGRKDPMHFQLVRGY